MVSRKPTGRPKIRALGNACLGISVCWGHITWIQSLGTYMCRSFAKKLSYVGEGVAADEVSRTSEDSAQESLTWWLVVK